VNGNPLQLTHGSARNSERRETTSGTVGIGCSAHFRTSPAPQALTPAAGTADELAALDAPAEDRSHAFQLEVA